MKNFNQDMIRASSFLALEQKPDINNLLTVLRNKKPPRYTLFEFFMNNSLYETVTAGIAYRDDQYKNYRKTADTFLRLGYDYVTVHGNNMTFPFENDANSSRAHAKTISQNREAVFSNRGDVRNYPWPDPYSFPSDRVDVVREYLPPGMGLIVPGSTSVQGALIRLIGYENLCYMLADDPDLVQEIADNIGSRVLAYFEIFAKHPAVDALIVNDDWGFAGQTLLSPASLRRYVIPWHKKIVKAIHDNNKPVVLHSCGNLENVMDDIIDDIGYDGKHSYEDKILPVEEAYDRFGSRIAVMGGLDIDFMSRSTPEQVYNRACAMLKHSESRGGYALGTGNSIPDFIPLENCLAMMAAVVFNR